MNNSHNYGDGGDIVVSIKGVGKTYKSGFTALKGVDLDIRRGEILALLGPNGAGKTTLIGIVTGLVNASEGTILVDGDDVRRDYRRVRPKIGLVPQELFTDSFETVWDTVSFSRGLFGKPADPAHIERVLKALSLWNKKDNKILSLSGGMKRRVLIAKALSHEPSILFLDEPTAGVDVELRHDMWNLVRQLREQGVTVILTTHYIEEAEDMADRIAVINNGEIILVQDKQQLMGQLGKKELHLQLPRPLDTLPPAMSAYPLTLSADGQTLVYTYNKESEENTGASLSEMLRQLGEVGIELKDLQSRESSLEDIFVSLVRKDS
ncbi:multidrug ABC transporter ATP-binding protein [Advenella kashmirensis W13003]|uniref:Multidrug ABC transporter ATP-binding protein n=1 Tax=Advenella kashmirensis W13003 TaxID=1424334 RepID=V8QTV3_9BURK|nr:ABC transporter ATP-binding protein [Advenella kashmirensis]ETF02750.1 multidrug ABC transporter ATP-binding protein [Advenella kashmirensis W13003]